MQPNLAEVGRARNWVSETPMYNAVTSRVALYACHARFALYANCRFLFLFINFFRGRVVRRGV